MADIYKSFTTDDVNKLVAAEFDNMSCLKHINRTPSMTTFERCFHEIMQKDKTYVYRSLKTVYERINIPRSNEQVFIRMVNPLFRILLQ